MNITTRQPFVDNKRGATMRHQAHRSTTPKPLHYRRPLFVWALVGVALALFLSA